MAGGGSTAYAVSKTDDLSLDRPLVVIRDQGLWPQVRAASVVRGLAVLLVEGANNPASKLVRVARVVHHPSQVAP